MASLIAAGCAFLGIHLLVSGTRLRDRIVSAIGESAYLGLFSLGSLGVLLWLVLSYNRARVGGADPIFYVEPNVVRDLALPIVALAFLLAIPGLMLPNPTSLRQEAVATRDDAVRGVLRITRHPFLWGVALWAAIHLAANGDEASIIFFGSFFLVAALGPFSIDAKRKWKMGRDWSSFAARTSNLPFAAIVAGRSNLSFSELFDWRLLVAALAFLVLLFAHARLFGVSPFPGGWIPV
jgi:uncharacterized membrane protein